MKRFFKMSAAALMCIALMGCNAESKFDGNKISNVYGFQMDYSVLNQRESSSLTLAKGDSLQVSVAQEAGTVDVTVGIDGKEPIYEGKCLDDKEFTLNILEAGDYLIAVTGHNARGSVAFTRVAIEPETSRKDAPDKKAMYKAYQFALQQIAFEHVYPDGTDTGFDGVSGFIEDNHFAIFDINNDGIEELVVQFVTAPMAGNIETIYAYNEAGNTVETMLTVFPAVTYYENGIVKEEWSHGSDLAGDDYWPYNLYQYNEGTGKYNQIAEVNMWSKSVDTVNYKGDSYPEDIDAEKAGTVFIISQNGGTEIKSKSDYEKWFSEIIGNAQTVKVPYMSLNEKNIKGVSQ